MKARILVIEDEMAINDLLCMNLEAAGYETVGYLDGNDASEGVAQDHEFQCALVDIMLPGMNGLELLSKLKASPKNRDIPVIMLTAKGAEYDKVKALDAGADDYVTKPFGMMELVSRIKAVLRRTQKDIQDPQDVIVLGDIEMNTKNMK